MAEETHRRFIRNCREKRFHISFISADYASGKIDSPFTPFFKHSDKINYLEGFLNGIDEEGIFEEEVYGQIERFKLRKVDYSDFNTTLTLSRANFLKLGKPKRLVEVRKLFSE